MSCLELVMLTPNLRRGPLPRVQGPDPRSVVTLSIAPPQLRLIQSESGRDKYPHAYNDYEHFSFPHASKPYLEFPIAAGSVYDGSSPGADRVVIGSIASDYSSAVYCAVITHDGQRANGFAECSDDTMNPRGKGDYEGQERKGHHHRRLLDKIEL